MARNTPVEIRQLDTIDEFGDAVKLQRLIWGFDDLELLPLRFFVVASKIGGQVLGAFEGRELVAFCLVIPGLKHGGERTGRAGPVVRDSTNERGGKSYLHSHMLGVLPRFRNSGLGRRMKFEQRDYALRSGIDLIEWTFDPLEIKNAYFNIERLGVIARRYVHNQYGTTSSRLHGGLPTDRLVAEWWIRSNRADACAQGERLQRSIAQATVAVPNDIAEIRERDPSQAREIQTAIGEQFEQHFRAGLAVIGFLKQERAGSYLLGRWESK